MGPDEEVPREVFLQPGLSFGSPKLVAALSFVPLPTLTLTLGMG